MFDAQASRHARLQLDVHTVELARDLGMQRLAHCHQQFGRFVELGRRFGVEDDGEPVDGVHVAQTADVVLQVGSQHPAGFVGVPVSFRGRFYDAPDDRLAFLAQPAGSAVDEFLERSARPGDQPRRQGCGGCMDVVVAAIDRFLRIGDGMADLEAGVPQGIEDVPQRRLGELWVGASSGPQEEQIDVGVRGQLASSIASDRDDRARSRSTRREPPRRVVLERRQRGRSAAVLRALLPPASYAVSPPQVRERR